jgi:hypothetical protein
MKRARNAKGRFVARRRPSRRRRRNDPGPAHRRRRYHARRRRSNPYAYNPPRRRRYHRRRRSNPAMRLPGGIEIPNVTDIVGGVAGAVGSKYGAKHIPFVKDATGFMAPLATLGVGLVGALALKMIPVPFARRLAKPVALGAAIMAGIDLLKLTPIGAQLGGYAIPSGYTPVLSSGMGDFPSGFVDQSQLGEGDGGFSSEADLGQLQY